MDPGQFFAALRARFGLFSLALAGTVAAAVVLSLMMPKSYRATASLVVNRREEQSLSSSLNGFASPLDSPLERTGYLQTQVDIIHSPKVARKVVANLKLEDEPKMRAGFDKQSGETLKDWIAGRLLPHLNVDTSQSSVIRISYDASTPQDAAKIANGFAQAYMDTLLQLRVDPTRQAAAWFDKQLQTLGHDLQQAQSKMTEYQQQHDIISANESLDDEYARLADLSKQLIAAQQRTADLKTREQQARRALADGTPLDQLPEIQSDSYIQKLSSDLLAGEARLQMLATQYGPNHPKYRSQLAENRARRRKLNAQMKKVLAATEQKREASQQHEADIQAALTAQRARVLKLNESRDQLSVLKRNVDSAQTAYDTARQRFVVNQVDSRASQANVALLSAAMPPHGPHRPNMLLNVALSFMVGGGLGLGLIVLTEASDRRLRSVGELTQNVDVPLLGELGPWNPSKRLLLTGPTGESSTFSDED